jgi:uncharacterized membrane protein
MATVPSETLYHRWLGWHAPAMRRLVVAGAIGLVVGLAVLVRGSWQLALIAGWDGSGLVFLLAVVPIISRSDPQQTALRSTSEDETQSTARLLLVGATIVSLLAVIVALGQAGRESGSTRLALIAFVTFTLVVSWTLLNTVFTLRYAHIFYSPPVGGMGFSAEAGEPEPPSYRDFAYVAFTIGMTYQVSDTAVRDRRSRRTVLSHALLSYVFGVVIVATSINLIAGLVK